MKKAGQIAAAMFCLCLAAAAAVPVNAAGAVQADCYWYNKWGDPVTIPDVCDLTQTVELATLTNRELKGITDAFVCADGTIYILDQGGPAFWSRIRRMGLQIRFQIPREYFLMKKTDAFMWQIPEINVSSGSERTERLKTAFIVRKRLPEHLPNWIISP